ncbi:cytochrome P450 [Pseudonocardia halophobica]|uniref:cytochrome P450 n=1 Tax=Pseudonocardia halophobica TaxID=29401 RepID=UPI003D91ACF0
MTQSTTTQGSQTLIELTDYRELEEALKRGRELVLEGTKAESDEFVHGTLIAVDGREHLNRRRALMRMINPSQPWGAEGKLIDEVFADNLQRVLETVEPVDGVRRFDLVDFLRRIIWRFTAKFVGIDGIDDDEQTGRFVKLAVPVVSGLSIEYLPEDKRAEVLEIARNARKAIREELFDPSLERRRALIAAGAGEDELPADLLTSLLQADTPSSDDMIFKEAIQLLAASVNNPVLQLTLSLDDVTTWLDEHPEDCARISDREFVNAAVKETLRLHRASRPYLVRRAVKEITLETTGRVIPEGAWVAGYLMEADHDESVFGANPEAYDPYRVLNDPKVPHFGLAFGAGPHVCIGRPMLLWEQGNPESQGVQTKVLRFLLENGVRRDADGVQSLESERGSHRFTHYDVIVPEKTA